MAWQTMLEGRKSGRSADGRPEQTQFGLKAFDFNKKQKGRDIPIQYKMHLNFILEVGQSQYSEWDVRNEDIAAVDEE